MTIATLTLGAVPRLSRRDRAACELSLAWCRVLAGNVALDLISASDLEALRYGGTVARNIRRALDRSGNSQAMPFAERKRAMRLLRVRLALYLRALLRADAGDMGRRRWECPRCGCDWIVEDHDDEGRRIWWCARDRVWTVWERQAVPVHHRMRPLWQDAGGAR